MKETEGEKIWREILNEGETIEVHTKGVFTGVVGSAYGMSIIASNAVTADSAIGIATTDQIGGTVKVKLYD